MDIEKFSRIFGGSLIIAGLFLWIFVIISLIDYQPEISQVDCYDRLGNKIVGLVCEQSSTSPSIPLIIVGIVLIVSGILLCSHIYYPSNYYLKGVNI